MRAGSKTEFITIEKSTTSQSGTGEPTDSWAQFKTMQASVTDKTGTENFNSGQYTGLIIRTFKIDYIFGTLISPKTFRIKHDGLLFDIISTFKIGNNEALEITAKAVY